jgi:hypothetical protein
MRQKTDQSGQAIIEYVILLVLILSIGGLLFAGVRSSRDKMWKQMICDVSAACPDCPATESAKRALPQAGNCRN